LTLDNLLRHKNETLEKFLEDLSQKEKSTTKENKRLRDCKMRRRNERYINQLLSLAADIKESTEVS
jgi:hypothetical protein